MGGGGPMDRAEKRVGQAVYRNAYSSTTASEP
jgi:hypothetical protein